MSKITVYRSGAVTEAILYNLSIGGGAAPFAANTQVPFRLEVTVGTYNIAAGAYHVQVNNTSFTQTITVDGGTVNSLTPGGIWKAQFENNLVTNRVDFVPAVEIILPAGATAIYSSIHPSP